MLLSALAIFLLTALSVYAIPQGASPIASPESQPDVLPSKTSQNAVTSGPRCTGCVLQAVQPTPLSYPGTVYCLDVHIISTIPKSIEYTFVGSDGCTSYTSVSYTPPNLLASTTSITWETSGTSLTWPNTYLAYSTFEAGTWSRGKDSYCTINPTTVHVQSPIFYPASSFPASFAPVPSQVVQSIIHDPSILLPFNISTCTATGALPGLLGAELDPACSCTTVIAPPPSCIHLSPITYTSSNTFILSGYHQNPTVTTLAPAHMARDTDPTHKSSHYTYITIGK